MKGIYKYSLYRSAKISPVKQAKAGTRKARVKSRRRVVKHLSRHHQSSK